LCLLSVSGGEGGDDGVSVSDCQTAAAAAVGSAGRLAQAVSPAVGYYLLPGYQTPYSAGVHSTSLSFTVPSTVFLRRLVL